MCGLFGAIKFNGFFNSKDHERFNNSLNLVSYRGPDSSGFMSFCTSEKMVGDVSKFNVFFGHRRLSIIDLSERGNQPFTDGSGLWIIYNGEIFNYIELREDIKKKGYRFRTDSDTEVILKVYQIYGEDGFHLLNGMWSFAILDMNMHKVILSRDRFAIKPLFYTQVNDEILFSSEIKQLLPILPTKEIDQNIMFCFLAQGIVDNNDNTFYKNIFKVTPKNNLVIYLNSGVIEKRKYWDYNVDQSIDSKNIIESFRELFIDSVRIRLRSDVKIGALLSGGLDSSSISIIANKLNNGNLETYSVISEDSRFSEEKFIDILVKGSGIKNRKLLYHHEDALNSIKDVIYHNDEPIGGFSIVAQYNIFKKIKKETDIVVVLSGQGGDEILMGYLKYFFFNLKDLIKQKKYYDAVNQIFMSLIKKTVLYQFKMSSAYRYLPAINPYKTKNIKQNYLRYPGKLEHIWEYSSIKHRQILDIDNYSVPALARYEDRNSMAHSLETRLPFLDHRLVNLVLSMSTELKLKNGWTKHILREAMHDLPNEIRWRRDKQGFSTPEDLWLKNNYRPMIENMFGGNSLLHEMGVIDSKIFLNYYHRYLKGENNIWHSDISRVLFAELWLRMFFGNGYEEFSVL